MRYATDGFGFWLAVTQDSDEPVGQAGLLMQELDGVMRVELGDLTHRPFRRRGNKPSTRVSSTSSTLVLANSESAAALRGVTRCRVRRVSA